MSDREEWPLLSRASRGGNPPTQIQLQIIECLRRWGMPPFGEPSTEDELLTRMTDAKRAKRDEVSGLAQRDGYLSYYVAGLTAEALREELYDAVLAGWVKMTPWGPGYDTWERPRPERTDLPVEDRERRRGAAEQGGVWVDAQGGKHVVSPGGIEMGIEGAGSDDEVMDIMRAIDADQEQRS